MEGLCPACLLDGVMHPSGSATAWDPPAVAELAAVLPQYGIERFLGRGGMGAVYQGRQVELDRAVAIKILPPDLETEEHDFAARFKMEARAMARLKHPGIVTVHDFGQTADGLLFFVMEYVAGMDVQAMLTHEGKLQPGNAVSIAAHVCEALSYAHEQGIVHRDIKPANVIVGYDGHVRVADFGLAKILDVAHPARLPHSDLVMGTPAYLAPEARTAGTAIDGRADVYAVGVMLAHMLIGRVPREADEALFATLTVTDPRLAAIVGRAMRKDRNERYAGAADLRADLVGLLSRPLAHTLPLPASMEGGEDSSTPGSLMSRRQFVFAGAGAAGLALGGGTVLVVNEKRGTPGSGQAFLGTDIATIPWFRTLLAHGLADEESLTALALVRPFQGGYLGISRDALDWTAAVALADRSGGWIYPAEPLDVESGGASLPDVGRILEAAVHAPIGCWLQRRTKPERTEQFQTSYQATDSEGKAHALLQWYCGSAPASRLIDALNDPALDQAPHHGPWTVAPGRIRTANAGGHSSFVTPFAPSSTRYEMDATFSTGPRGMDVSIGFPVPNGLLVLGLAGNPPGTFEGHHFSSYDGLDIRSQPQSIIAAGLAVQTRFRFLTNQRHRIRAAFGDRGIDVMLDGKLLFSWRGDPNRLGTRPGFHHLPADRVAVGGYKSEITFYQVVGREILPGQPTNPSAQKPNS
jgi:hypothetical protein